MNSLASLLRRFLTLVIAVIVTTSVFGQKKTITLNKESINDYSIVVFNYQSSIQKKAAKELQHYLHLIFNVKPKISGKKKMTDDGHYFLLGEGFLVDVLSSTDTLSKDAFVVAFRNGNIYLGGKDDLNVQSVKAAFFSKKEQANFGSLYATYDFLEERLGVHWFFPTYLGEFVPEAQTYYFEETTTIKIPAFIERAFGFKLLYFDKDTAMTWLLRNKASVSNMKMYNHSWNDLIPSEVYFEHNPKLFAEVDDERRAYQGTKKYAQLCTTNDDLVRLFVEASRNYLKNQPSDPYLPISPNDNKLFCECSDCRLLDKQINLNPKYSRLSDRIFSFYNRVADSIWKDYPDVPIGGYAYKEYAVVSPNITLADNLHIRLSINNFGFGNRNCSTLDTLFLIIQSWKDHLNKGFLCFPYGNTWVYPYLKTKEYQELIIELRNNNFDKIRLFFYPDWYTQGLDIWLITKMVWDPGVNIDSLKMIYYQSVFPESYPIIHSFHNTLQRKIDKLNVCVPTYTLPGARKTKEIFLELFPVEMLNSTQKHLQIKYNSGKLSPRESENVSNFIKMLEFLELEQHAFETGTWGKLVFDRKTKTEATGKILQLKESLILSGNSKYWDPAISPSFYIRK